jgi:hypothetical protein
MDHEQQLFGPVSLAGDLAMMRAEYDDAFADIAERLSARFGGQVIERMVDVPR